MPGVRPAGLQAVGTNSMPGNRIVYLEHTSHSLADNPLGDPAARRLPVYLPPSYDDSKHRYPVIWVLAPFTSWGERLFNLYPWEGNITQIMDGLIESGDAPPAIMAFPDCFTRFGGSQYVNSAAVGAYENYVIGELVPLIDMHFRTLAGRDNRGVMGHSSGGYGALMLSMRHPDVFGAVACHSGDMAFECCYRPDIPGAVRTFEAAGGLACFIESLLQRSYPRERRSDWYAALNTVAMSACYSPNPRSPSGFDLPFDPHTGAINEEVWARWAAFDPLHAALSHVDTLRSLRLLYFDCGIRDEYNLFLGARRLHQMLNVEKVPHTYEEYDGGHHDVNWRYRTSLPLLGAALSPQGG
jgi:enterochelin esterase-like enzyme